MNFKKSSRPFYTGLSIVGLILFGLFFQNCTGRGGFDVTTNEHLSTLPKEQLAVPTQKTLPAISVLNKSNGRGQFFIEANGSQFFPRGTNYVRLDSANNWHSTFEATYSANQVEQSLSEMKRLGYNYVRVFLDTTSSGQGFGLDAPGLPDEYIDRVADFISRSIKHNIYVVLTGGIAPGNYHSLIEKTPSQSDVSFEWGYNYFLMHPGCAKATARFYIDLLGGLKSRNPALITGIMAIDLWNEAFYQMDQRPLSQMSGRVTIYDVQYDLSNYIDRQQMMNASAVAWFRTLRSAIKQQASNILVTTSVFSPAAVGRQGFDGGASGASDLRMPVNPLSLVDYGEADFVDIHLYVHTEDRFDLEMKSLGINQNHKITVPIFMGEYGAFQPRFNLENAKLAIKNHLVKSCDYGFSGWGLWTWDTSEQKEAGGRFWTATESSGAINSVVAPRAIENICQ